MDNSVYFPEYAKRIDVESGITIAEMARNSGIAVDQPCAGRGSCGKCRILLEGNVSEPTAKERELLSEDELLSGIRLACQTSARPGMEVKIIGGVPSRAQILSDFEHDNGVERDVILPFSKGAIAIDIGTTTLVTYLVDLEHKKVSATESAINPQVVFGADVISRISYVAENDLHLTEMQNCLVKKLDEMITQLCSEPLSQKIVIEYVIIAGNATMEHIFAGISPVVIGKAPFAPKFYKAPDMRASNVGMHIKGDPIIYMLPNIYGFVGGDIVSGIIYSGMQKNADLSLLIDIGTNNEMVLGNSDFLLCCSAAAGPALEGAKISCGMRAASGAIEKVWYDKDICAKTIADDTACGICGSGLVDAIAVLLKTNILQRNGKFNSPDGIYDITLLRRLHGALARDKSFEVTKGTSSISISQRDVREFQLAKAAIKTGIDLMLKISGKSLQDVKKIFLAGAFGNYIDKVNAVATGILPEVPLQNIVAIGNSSGLGACMLAIDASLWCETDRILDMARHVELAAEPDFQDCFINNLFF